MLYRIETTSVTGPGRDDAERVVHSGGEAVLATLVGEASTALCEFEAERIDIVAHPEDGGHPLVFAVRWAPWPWSDSGQRVQVRQLGAAALVG